MGSVSHQVEEQVGLGGASALAASSAGAIFSAVNLAKIKRSISERGHEESLAGGTIGLIGWYAQ